MTNPEEIMRFIETEVLSIRPIERMQAVKKTLVNPICEERTYVSSSGCEETGYLWIFAIVREAKVSNVGMAYSVDGYAQIGAPWGLVDLESSTFGSSGSWYRSLLELVDESCYF